MSSLLPLSILSSSFFFLLPVLKLVLVCSAYSTSRRTTRRTEWCYASISLLAVLGTLGGTFELLSIKKLLYMRVAAKICRVLLELAAGSCTIILIVLSTPTTTVPVMNMIVYVTVLAVLQFCGVLLSLLHVSPLLGPLFYLLFATAALPLQAYVLLVAPSMVSTRITDSAISLPLGDNYSPARSYTTLSVPPSPSSIQKKAMSLDLPSPYKHSIAFPVHQRVSLDRLERTRTSTEERTFVITPGSRAFGVCPSTAPIQSRPTPSTHPKTRPTPSPLHQSPEDFFTTLHPRILWTLILLSEIAVLIASGLQICGSVLSGPSALPQYTLPGSLGDVPSPLSYPPAPISHVGEIGEVGIANRPWQLYTEIRHLNAINEINVLATDGFELSTATLAFDTLSDILLVLAVAFVMCAAFACIYVDVPCDSSFGPITHTHPVIVSTSIQTRTEIVPSEATFKSNVDSNAIIGSEASGALFDYGLKPTNQLDSIDLAPPPCHSTRRSSSPRSRCRSEDQAWNMYNFGSRTKYDSYDVQALVDLEGPKDMFTPMPQRRRERKNTESGPTSPSSSHSRRRDLFKLRMDHTRNSSAGAIVTTNDTWSASGAYPRARLSLSRMSLPRHLPKLSLVKCDDASGASFSRSLSLPLSGRAHIGTVLTKNSPAAGTSLSRSSSFASPRPKRRPVQVMRSSSTMSMIDMGYTQFAGSETEDVLVRANERDNGDGRKPLDRTSMKRIGLDLRDPSLNLSPSPYSFDQFALTPCPGYSDDETSDRDPPFTDKASAVNHPTTISVSNPTITRPPPRPARSPTFQFLPNFPSLKLSQIKSGDIKKSPSRMGSNAIRMSVLSVSSSTPIWARDSASVVVNNNAGNKMDEAGMDLDDAPLGESEEGSEQQVLQTPSKKKFQRTFLSSSPTKSTNFKPRSCPSSPSSPPLNTFTSSKSPSLYSSPSFYSNPSPTDQNQAMNVPSKSSPSNFSPKISPPKHFPRAQSQPQPQPRPKMRPPIFRKFPAIHDHGYTPFRGYDPDPFAAPEPGAMVRDSGVDLVEGQGQTRMSAWGTLTLPVPTSPLGLPTGVGTAKRTGMGLRRSPTSPALVTAARSSNPISLSTRPRLKSGPSAFQSDANGIGRAERGGEGAGVEERIGGQRRRGAGLEGESLAEFLPVEDALLAQKLLKRLNRRAERGNADRKPGQGRSRERTRESEKVPNNGAGRSFLLSMIGNGVAPSRPF